MSSSSPMRPDKENRQQPPSSTTFDESMGTVASASGASDLLFKPPSYPVPSSSVGATVKAAAASPLAPRPTSTMLRTPPAPGSSSLAVVARTPTSSRMLELGAVRILNPQGSSVLEKPYRRRIVKCRRRKITSTTAAATASYSSGTAGSNESTATWDDASMEVDGIPDPSNTSSEHEQSSVYSLAMDLAMETTPVRSTSPGPRRDCINPVALTLWRGGQEDWHDLDHRDRSILAARTGYHYSSSPSSWSSSSSSSHPSPHPIRSERMEQDAPTMRTMPTSNSISQRHCNISRPIPTRKVYSPPRSPYDP